ncbi:unnamed protein product, partial [Effrenium voratum]
QTPCPRRAWKNSTARWMSTSCDKCASRARSSPKLPGSTKTRRTPSWACRQMPLMQRSRRHTASWPCSAILTRVATRRSSRSSTRPTRRSWSSAGARQTWTASRGSPVRFPS